MSIPGQPPQPPSRSTARSATRSARPDATTPPDATTQPDTNTPAQQHRIAALFDLDKTIIATSSALAYGKEFLQSGLISPSEALQMSMTKASYMLGGHNAQQLDATRDKLSKLIVGWDQAQIQAIASETMHSIICPTIYAEARALIEQHKAKGHEVVIISASAKILVEPIAQELGIEHVIASELEVKDGKFTGELLFYCKGEAKAKALAARAATRGYDLSRCFAYSDSISDVPMLEAVGHPVVVNPDRQLRKIAAERGWQMMSFDNPVPLFTMPSKRDMTISTGLAAAVAGIAGLWWAFRRPRA
ncbi:Phosphoserine phosphatase [Corynebacterium pseudopelargi]|uniref:Phosphoserine phosphatase n=2 Tax=Corynebacterium pseudopelargi TaxID=2080757 RepID=A0A3G6J207_9CORY|nr:HAD family hydrolase [Corynebacterium pseudopelargi]AZA10174.1 Phosphoserine phosphatase [Corynebacterium pseudopelargi]